MDRTNEALLSDLIVLAKADDKVTTSEYDFILTLAETMEIGKKAVDVLFKNPLPSVVQKTELDRITHFYKLILLMNVDHETHEKEITMIRDFGIKMGIRPGVMDQMLIKMEQYENKIIPSDEIMKIFKTYYN
ncbi:MAG: putative tellurite resistance protein B-like protein [Planctomycetota bacterium]|jgi:uncharacterized tellurite resistance protein B-like protein|uniref:tellurite resistance TerB family protein n=1 Tax=Patiriisocius sp. Uisw_047 TaxID=3230969 RepID=UPI0039EB46EF